jgi:hypothetical protein
MVFWDGVEGGGGGGQSPLTIKTAVKTTASKQSKRQLGKSAAATLHEWR